MQSGKVLCVAVIDYYPWFSIIIIIYPCMVLLCSCGIVDCGWWLAMWERINCIEYLLCGLIAELLSIGGSWFVGGKSRAVGMEYHALVVVDTTYLTAK